MQNAPSWDPTGRSFCPGRWFKGLGWVADMTTAIRLRRPGDTRRAHRRSVGAVRVLLFFFFGPHHRPAGLPSVVLSLAPPKIEVDPDEAGGGCLGTGAPSNAARRIRTRWPENRPASTTCQSDDGRTSRPEFAGSVIVPVGSVESRVHPDTRFIRAPCAKRPLLLRHFRAGVPVSGGRPEVR